jgi:sarcosine oxidase subunit alpha
MSPFLKRSIALALIKGGHSIIGEKVYIPLENGKTVSAMIVDRVFYDREGARQDE